MVRPRVRLSVDGIEIVASLVLLADRRSMQRSGWLPWVALAVGKVGSLAANVATAGPGMTSRVIAGWPALALLIVVKLLSGVLDQHAAYRSATSPVSMAHDWGASELSAPAVMPRAGRTKPQTVAVRTANDPADRGSCLAADAEPGRLRRLEDDDAGMLSAARAARDALNRNDHRLTGDALAARLRENG